MPETIEAVVAAAAFVVPGFVALFVTWLFLPVRRVEGTHFVLQCLSLSGIIYALASPVAYFAIRDKWWQTEPRAFVCSTIATLLLLPLLVGYGLVQLQRRRKSASFLGMGMLHPTPQAWDYLFEKREPLWMIVSLKDGTRIAGLFGVNSLASSEPGKHDLYLEKHYPIEDGKVGASPENSRGVLISADEISYIECFAIGEGNEQSTESTAPDRGISAPEKGLPADTGTQTASADCQPAADRAARKAAPEGGPQEDLKGKV